MGNIGGFIGINDRRLYEQFCRMVVIHEGTRFDGGMSGRDMEALARGIYEMTDDDYIGSRVRQVQYLGKLLLEAKVPIVEPVGGFAVCLDERLPTSYPSRPVAGSDVSCTGSTLTQAYALWSAGLLSGT